MTMYDIVYYVHLFFIWKYTFSTAFLHQVMQYSPIQCLMFIFLFCFLTFDKM